MNKRLKNFLIAGALLTTTTALVFTSGPVSDFNDNKNSKEAKIKNLQKELSFINDVEENGFKQFSDLEQGSHEKLEAEIMAIKTAEKFGKTLVENDTNGSDNTIDYQTAYEIYQEIVVSRKNIVERNLEVAKEAPVHFYKTTHIGTH